MVKCGSCGGRYTVVAKERNKRKTQGTQECSNSRTITRDKLEAGVLARLREGIMTPALAQQFAAEVDRLMATSPDDATAVRAELGTRLRKMEAAIDRLLDRLEGDEGSECLMYRMVTRGAERDALRQELTKSADPQPTVLPTKAELEGICRAQLELLEALLTGSDHMVSANAFLREFLGEVRVWGDAEARDDTAVEIRGEASRIYQPAVQAVNRTQKSAPWGAGLSAMQISVVAGA